jgi:hypothetical protein
MVAPPAISIGLRERGVRRGQSDDRTAHEREPQQAHIRRIAMTKAFGFIFAALLAPLSAVAQTVDGPFASTTAIQTFWNGPSAPNFNAYVYVNGDYFLAHSGFNPWLIKHYFHCYSTTVYKTHCGNMRDGDGSLDNIIALFPAGDEVTLNGTLYRAAAPGNFNSVDILVCITDDSVSQYYKVGSYWTGFGPPFASTCY